MKKLIFFSDYKSVAAKEISSAGEVVNGVVVNFNSLAELKNLILGAKNYTECEQILHELNDGLKTYEISGVRKGAHTGYGFETKHGLIADQLTSKPYVFLPKKNILTNLVGTTQNPLIHPLKQFTIPMYFSSGADFKEVFSGKFYPYLGKAWYLSDWMAPYRAYHYARIFLDFKHPPYYEKNNNLYLINKEEDFFQINNIFSNNPTTKESSKSLKNILNQPGCVGIIHNYLAAKAYENLEIKKSFYT
jgi:hypothetical protein